MEETTYKAGSKVNLGRPAVWNKEYNNCIQEYFEIQKNIVSCHMAWIALEDKSVTPHYVLCINAVSPDPEIGNGLVKYCIEKMGGNAPLTDLFYDQGDAMSKMIKIVGKRLYPKRRFGIF